MIRIKRVYEKPSGRDGIRILVDRMWPRGCTKEQARLDAWRKDLAPSTALRTWFGHNPAKWMEFQARYRKELSLPAQKSAVEDLARLAHAQTITLLYGASDTEHNQAVVLKHCIENAKGAS
ncbi:MAG: DUF488 domain-containing protein [Nitrospira sp.]|nr:DUF488 domain-containing protein [Nitrospira sp.]